MSAQEQKGTTGGTNGNDGKAGRQESGGVSAGGVLGLEFCGLAP